MKTTILIILFFVSYVAFGQSIQNEPEKLFKEFFTLDNETISKYGIKTISFYCDSLLSSKLEFDKNGNLVMDLSNDNSFVKKAVYYYDSLNRILKIEYFNPKDEFNYGYYYVYEGFSAIEYEIGNDEPRNRIITLKDEGIIIYSDYNEGNKWSINSVTFKNPNGSYDRELRYNSSGLYCELKYYYDTSGKKGETVNIDYHNGLKMSEKSIDNYKTDINGNEIEYYSAYSTGKLKLVSKKQYNNKNQLTKAEYFSIYGKKWNIENFTYNANCFIEKKEIQQDLVKTELFYIYNNYFLVQIIKNSNDKIDNFNIVYEFY